MLNRDSTTTGVALGVLAYGLFVVHDSGIKLLVSDGMPVWEVLFVRSASVLAVCLAVGRGPLLLRAVRTPLKRPLAFRGAINLAAWLCFYSAAATLPMAQWLCLYFAAPLMVTIMARQILGETVTRARWAAVIIGFIGVLFASDPLGVRPTFAAMLVLTAAALWGYGIILMRQIARKEPALLQMLATNSVFTVATGIACLFAWQAPTPHQMMLLAGVSLLGGAAQFLVYEAARLMPASVMATVEYSALPWAFLLGYVIWRDIPPAVVCAGAGLIILAGAILVRAERRAAPANC